MSASKQKGTGGETELRKLLEERGLHFVRTPASSDYDLTNARPDVLELEPLEVLATRPDRGEWLMTMRLNDFVDLLTAAAAAPWSPGVWETHIEVKRYARFALHTIFEKKFGPRASPAKP